MVTCLQPEDHNYCYAWCLPYGGWSWSRGLWGLPGGRNWYLPSGWGSWVLSLWWAGLCHMVCFEEVVSSVWLKAACLLMGGAVFLSCSLFGLRHSSSGTCRWLVRPGLVAKMGIIWRANADKYSLGSLPLVSLPPRWASQLLPLKKIFQGP